MRPNIGKWFNNDNDNDNDNNNNNKSKNNDNDIDNGRTKTDVEEITQLSDFLNFIHF